MDRPNLIVKENLLVPVKATIQRLNQIEKEARNTNSSVSLNGLFIMMVAYIESMQKEVLLYYLKYMPSNLSSNKTIEINKTALIENENFDFLEQVISDYIDSTPYWKFMDMFYKELNIPKPDTNLNKEVFEIRSTRNELVHKNLQLDYKRKRIIELNHIDNNILRRYIDIYIEYLNHIQFSISERYAEHTKLKALRKLWHYTFSTPLCANFEDYWHIDEKNDAISGYKNPEKANGLSSSERFLLDIWISQVTYNDMRFINWASVSKEVKSKMFLFLKLSNDVFLYP